METHILPSMDYHTHTHHSNSPPPTYITQTYPSLPLPTKGKKAQLNYIYPPNGRHTMLIHNLGQPKHLKNRTHHRIRSPLPREGQHEKLPHLHRHLNSIYLINNQIHKPSSQHNHAFKLHIHTITQCLAHIEI